ncbi:hypothetical protein [Chitinimonas sp. BJB300]|uniref:hypothetical protein n=1 Tax=Chitinimonas sp. BJB300 TaxID=1559339 RepID=UPI002106F70F|nr:hypothetical protein [Chitinimonas sp. BJB300]
MKNKKLDLYGPVGDGRWCSEPRPGHAFFVQDRLHLQGLIAADYNATNTTYKKRWAVEVFHQSLRSNASLAKSPTHTVRTQSNHVFMTICAAFKLECLSIKTKKKPFALCRKLLINASRAAYESATAASRSHCVTSVNRHRGG